MNIDELYDKIQSGKVSKEEARRLISLSFAETAEKQIVDLNRDLRTGIPEIIYGEYKTYEQIIAIAERVLQKHKNVIISRSPDIKKLRDYFAPHYPVHADERIMIVGELPEEGPPVLIVSGGTADHPVAKEAELTSRAMGISPILYEDRGVAHPTRVLDAITEGISEQVKAVIVIAGMEASLATFVSSFVPLPVIGVPTSVGYGYKADETALISMLASCTPNLSVVNIDGGIRAAVIASLIVKQS
jgi:hypothetical protein